MTLRFVSDDLVTSAMVNFATLSFLSSQFISINTQQEIEELRTYPKILLAIWHEQIIPEILFHKKDQRKFCTMASTSKDGQLAATAVQKFGHLVFRGSSNRGGKETLNEMVTFLQKNKYSCAITVDGPKGPRRKCKLGIIELARKTQIPILPSYALVEKKYLLKKSWDKFQIPLFFGKILIKHCSKPIFINKEATNFSQFARQIEQSLEKLEDECIQESKLIFKPVS